MFYRRKVILGLIELLGGEVEKLRYLLDLLLSVINMTVQTVEIVEGLPGLEFENI